MKKRKKITSAEKKKITKSLAWDYFSLWIRHRDNWTCVLCGKTYNQGYIQQAGHVIPRGVTAIKWAEDNVFCQCVICNGIHRHNPQIYFDWFIRRFGLDKFQEYASAEVKHRMAKHNEAEILTLYRERLMTLLLTGDLPEHVKEKLMKLEKQFEKISV
jgi:hypothetical protein